ncbi:SLIT-ROBO Rho GTPase-activating protein 1 [Trichinella patagoniensis]|uniref:SLIT-ROBO Rho GTPase-activating protein 1 n=1 Tax=Trichinella patagoniensis TaxID=990121 RepID=A0A0V0ZHT6_9BILA|nr:SLIT-ROBO Rho GTPase-activating protein 1 [Trichinella patagoniensis]
MDTKMLKREKPYLHEFEAKIKEIRMQFLEQMKCLDGRTESQLMLLLELQDYCRKRAEIETDYSKNLDKLHRQIVSRHKTEKQKRENWAQFSSYNMWKMFVEDTKIESRNRSVVADLFNNHIAVKIAFLSEQMQRITKRCKEIGTLCHGEILRVLGELHTAMKTYQLCYAAGCNAEFKFRAAEMQKMRFEESWPKKIGCRRHKLLEKAYERKQAKYVEFQLKALTARNEYLLCVDAANAALHKYFADDLSDIIDCMDIGLQSSLKQIINILIDARQVIVGSELRSVDAYRQWCQKLDSRADKQRFLENNYSVFVLPRRFEFRPRNGDDVKQVSAQKPIQDELVQRYWQLHQRLVQLKTESEELWKTLETAEKAIVDLQLQPVVNVGEHFSIANSYTLRNNSCREPDAVLQKRKQDLHEIEEFYIQKLQHFLLNGNLISRLDARFHTIKTALGVVPSRNSTESTLTDSPSGRSSETAFARVKSAEVVNVENGPAALPSTVPSKPRRKRIGASVDPETRIRLFGGSLEEYVELTGQEIPLIIRSCVRMLSLFGLHHQGVFRVSGSQIEINAFKDAFERGEDPLSDVTDASDVNSVAGVLKLYFRELREPLFPFFMFDQFVECACLESREEFIKKLRELVQTLPRPVFVVMRYLFAFLNHLSEFSDENMMDPYNLAICFGPTLLPIPESKDQVFYHNHVNELMRNLIVFHDSIFPNDGGIVYEKYLLTDKGDDDDDILVIEDDDMISSVNGPGTFANVNGEHVSKLNTETKLKRNDHNHTNDDDGAKQSAFDLMVNGCNNNNEEEAMAQRRSFDFSRTVANVDCAESQQHNIAGLLANVGKVSTSSESDAMSTFNDNISDINNRYSTPGRNTSSAVTQPDSLALTSPCSFSSTFYESLDIESPTLDDHDDNNSNNNNNDQTTLSNNKNGGGGGGDGAAAAASAAELKGHVEAVYASIAHARVPTKATTYKRLSLNTYTASSLSERQPGLVQLQSSKTLSPQSLQEIQSELKAVLNSLATFTMQQQQQLMSSDVHQMEPQPTTNWQIAMVPDQRHFRPSGGTVTSSSSSSLDPKLLTPDLVKNLPAAAAAAAAAAAVASGAKGGGGGGGSFPNMLRAEDVAGVQAELTKGTDSGTSAEQFAQSGQSTLRKSSVSPLSIQQSELASFPYIDGDLTNKPQLSRSVKPPVPKKPPLHCIASAAATGSAGSQLS